jgi:transposase-like protein
MDRHKDSFGTPVSRLAIVDTGRRRRFTDEAKLQILEEGFSGDGRQVSATAVKHGVSRSQLYRWRQLAQAGNLGSIRIEGCQWAPKFPRLWTVNIPYVGGGSGSVISRLVDRFVLLLGDGRAVSGRVLD